MELEYTAPIRTDQDEESVSVKFRIPKDETDQSVWVEYTDGGKQLALSLTESEIELAYNKLQTFRKMQEVA